MRSGKPLDAINIYLEILTSFPIYKLIYKLKLLHKHHKPSFLAYTDSEEGTEVEPRVNVILPKESDRRNYFIPEQVVNFEQILGKACSIC